jgi:hypothetical protein
MTGEVSRGLAPSQAGKERTKVAKNTGIELWRRAEHSHRALARCFGEQLYQPAGSIQADVAQEHDHADRDVQNGCIMRSNKTLARLHRPAENGLGVETARAAEQRRRDA